MGKLAIYTIGLIAAVLLCSIRYYNGSFDLGLHYALVSRIQEHFSFPTCGTTADTYLEIMCGYPQVTHLLAAILGYLSGSTFAGMIILIAASVFISYASIFSMISFKNDAASLYAGITVCFICLLFISHTSMMGAEVRGNFFFSQIVGTAIIFAYISVQRELRFMPSLLLIFLLGWVYPIAAIQLGCAVIASMIMNRANSPKVALFAACAAAAIFLHPLFQESVKNASNNGSIGTGYIPATWTVPIIFLLVATSAFIALKAFARQLPLLHSTALPALSVGIAGAAIMQWIAYVVFAKGSDYIIQKHLFVCFTVLVLDATVIVISIFYRAIAPVRFTTLQSTSGLVVAALFCSLTIIPPVGGGHSVRSFIKIEQAARADASAIVGVQNHHEQFALEVGLRKAPITLTAQRHIREMQAIVTTTPK